MPDSNYLNYNVDVHKDCSPCPSREGERCKKIGTGLHETIETHLRERHGWSTDKIAGVRLGGMLSGKGDLEVLHLAHDGILLFSPRDTHTPRDA
jgi:hypothetical protein